MRIVALDKNTRENILSDLLKRDPNNYDTYGETVQEIVNQVKEKKDEAVFAYTKQFDGASINAGNVKVTEAEIKEAMEAVEPELLKIMKKAMDNIRDYHQMQVRRSWFDTKKNGVILGQKVTALESVGVYVPGGKAAYPSSVLMNIIPAEVAGVERIVMVTPPGKDGKVNPDSRLSGRGHGGVQGGGSPGGGGSGLWDPVHSQGQQDRGAGQYLCRPGKEGGVRPCEH